MEKKMPGSLRESGCPACDGAMKPVKEHIHYIGVVCRKYDAFAHRGSFSPPIMTAG